MSNISELKSDLVVIFSRIEKIVQGCDDIMASSFEPITKLTHVSEAVWDIERIIKKFIYDWELSVEQEDDFEDNDLTII